MGASSQSPLLDPEVLKSSECPLSAVRIYHGYGEELEGYSHGYLGALSSHNYLVSNVLTTTRLFQVDPFMYVLLFRYGAAFVKGASGSVLHLSKM